MSNLRLDLVEKKVEVLHRDHQEMQKQLKGMTKEIGELIVEIQQTVMGLSRGTATAVQAVTARLDKLEGLEAKHEITDNPGGSNPTDK